MVDPRKLTGIWMVSREVMVVRKERVWVMCWVLGAACRLGCPRRPPPRMLRRTFWGSWGEVVPACLQSPAAEPQAGQGP